MTKEKEIDIMIDTKKYEELCCERAEITAEDKVYRAMLEFMNANADRCFRERLFMEMQAWKDAIKDINANMTRLCDKLDRINYEIEQMDGGA